MCISDFQGGGIAQHGRCQSGRIDLEHGQIALFIGTDQRSIVFITAAGADRDRICVFDDVMIGDDVAVLCQDDTAAGTAADILLERIAAVGDRFGLNLNDRVCTLLDDRFDRAGIL